MESAVNAVIKEVLERGNVSIFNSMDIEDLSWILHRYKNLFESKGECPREAYIFLSENHYKDVIEPMVKMCNAHYESGAGGIFKGKSTPTSLIPKTTLYMDGITMILIIKPDISDILFVPYVIENIDHSKCFVIQIEGN